MKILATGMTGFLGANVLALLLSRGHEVVATRRPVSSMARVAASMGHSNLRWTSSDDLEIKKALDGGVEVILHCATHYGRAQSDPSAIIDSNIVLPLRLLAAGANAAVGCFVNTDTVLDKRISPYALSKHQFAEWLAAYSTRIASISVAMEHFYGGGDDPSKFTSQVLDAMARGNGELNMTPGEQRRYFLHVSDAAEALVLVCERWGELGERGHRRIEVGSTDSMSVRQFVDKTWELAGRPPVALNYGAIPYREGEVMAPEIDISAALSLGWRPKVDIESGLIASIELQRAQIEARRLS